MILLAAALFAQPLEQQGVPLAPRGAPQPTYTIEHAVIESVEVPRFYSGFVPSYVAARVRAPDGLRYTLTWHYFSGEMFIPRPGAICTFDFYWEAERRVEGSGPGVRDYRDPAMRVTFFECDTGRDRDYGDASRRRNVQFERMAAEYATERAAERDEGIYRLWPAIALPMDAMIDLAEQPLAVPPETAGAYRFRLFTSRASTVTSGCAEHDCSRRFFYLVVYRLDERPSVIVLQSTVAPAWRDVTVNSVREESGEVVVELSAGYLREDGGVLRQRFRGRFPAPRTAEGR